LRRAARLFDRVAGIGLVAAGAFIVFYWTLVLSSGDNALSTNPLTVWVEGLQADLTDVIGTVPLWLWVPVLAVPIAAATAYAIGRGRHSETAATRSNV
jgi:ABC-type polysaccharide/polyol phosphate export permease